MGARSGDGLLNARFCHVVERAHHAVRGQLGEQLGHLGVLVVVDRALDGLHRGHQIRLLGGQLLGEMTPSASDAAKWSSFATWASRSGVVSSESQLARAMFAPWFVSFLSF